MKKLLKKLTLGICFLAFGLCAKTQTIIDQGTCGANLTWVLTSDSTLTISGKGKMTDYDSPYDVPWAQYIITAAVIEIGVANISNFAFWYRTSLTSIIIGNTVTHIGNGAFYQCVSLTSVNIPNSVTNIGQSTFFACVALVSINIPNGVTTIGNFAFENCLAITSATSLNPEPIKIDQSVFRNINAECTLKVPTNAVWAYQNKEVWKEFNIVGGGLLVNTISNNIEYGYTTGDDLYQTNETATLTAIACNDCEFVNWTKNGVEISTDNSYTFTVTEDIELVANFIKNVGIVETQLIASLPRIYPNPTTGKIIVESEKSKEESIEIFDIYGKKHDLHFAFHVSQFTIDISHLSAGVYFLKIDNKVYKISKE
jgi:hypothetical protein